MSSFDVRRSIDRGHVDTLIVEECGLFRLAGWSELSSEDLEARAMLQVDGVILKAQSVARTLRPDVARAINSKMITSGFLLDYFVGAGAKSEVKVLWKSDDRKDGILLSQSLMNFACGIPHYDGLLNQTKVLRRSEIYGYGPPVDNIPLEVTAITDGLRESILDFGCGSGALVKYLRGKNCDAYGIEIDRPEIQQVLTNEIRPYIRLYNGDLPTPFKDRSFNTVIAVEVVEHIENFRETIIELARLTRDRIIITTPDMASIPILYRHSVVPWHLLEATHVSFFTDRSLKKTLQEFFPIVEVFRIGPNTINGTTFHTSVMAVGRKS